MELVNEELDEVFQEQNERIEAVEEELIEVRRRMDRLWHAVETTDLEINDIIPPHPRTPGVPRKTSGDRRGI